MARRRRFGRRKTAFARSNGTCYVAVPRSCKRTVSVRGASAKLTRCIARTVRKLHVSPASAYNICGGVGRKIRRYARRGARYCATCGRMFRHRARKSYRRAQTTLGMYPGYA